ncbi:MAG TPA: hypothetical protein VL155_03265 [Terriglobales bacterium]|jgi:hypothetical protein|nr:hypothetical protein [Terriglobales bacterium]
MKKIALYLLVVFSLMLCLAIVSTAKTKSASAKATTVKGWVTDAKCGAKAANATAEACTKKCLAAGQKMVFVTDKDHQVLTVANPDALKDHEGHHVSVKGEVDSSAGTVHVDSASML